MAQMNQKQRDFMVERVKSLTMKRINQIKATHASEIQDLANKKYEEFLEGIGVLADMDALKAAEEILDNVHQKMVGVVQGLKELYEDADSHGYYSDSNYYKMHDQFFRSCCRVIAKDEFYKTEAGQELKELERTKANAIDTIMLDGCKMEELTNKLNKILDNSGLTLLPSA